MLRNSAQISELRDDAENEQPALLMGHCGAPDAGNAKRTRLTHSMMKERRLGACVNFARMLTRQLHAADRSVCDREAERHFDPHPDPPGRCAEGHRSSQANLAGRHPGD